MPWYFPWPDYIKKKACRYLLQRYVGNFLEEKLTLDQLSVDIYSGTGTVKDVKLDVWALNELLESCGAPVEIRDGSVGSISVEIPWSSLLTSSSKVEIKGLQLTIQPKYRTEDVSPEGNGSISDSMWSSVTSSIMLAQECLKQDPTEGEQEAGSSQPFEGPELLAQTIESVLMRVEVTLIETVVRLEHVPQGSSTGIALEVHIERLRFFDEDAQEAVHRDQGSSVDPASPPRFEPAAFLHKNLQMMGVTVRCEEFPEQQRQSTFIVSPNGSPSSTNLMEDEGLKGGMEQSTFLHAASSPEMPPHHPREMNGIKGQESSAFTADLLGSCLVGECAGKQELKVKVKQNDHIAGPKADLDIYLASVNFFLSPKQVHLLTELFSGFLSPATSDVATVRGRQPNKVMQPEDYQRIETDLQEHHQLDQGLRKESWSLHDDDLDDDGDDDLQPTFQHSLDEDDVFFSMTSSMMSLSTFVHSNDMESSFSSSISSCSTDTSRTASSVSHMSYGSTLYRPPGASPMATAMPRSTGHKKHRHKKGYSEHLDDAAEMTRYKIRFSSITATILHEDPSPPPIIPASTIPSSSSSSSSLPSPASSQTRLGGGMTREEVLSQRAGYFFAALGKGGFRRKDKDDWADRFETACPHDHLRLIAAPFTLECECKSNSHWNVTLVEMSVGSVDLQECLFSRQSQTNSLPNRTPQPAEHIQILSMSGECGSEGSYATKPSIRTKLKHAQKIRNQTNKRRHIVKPTLDVSVELGVVTCEVDISIVDRLYTLLHPQPSFTYDSSGQRMYPSMQPTSLNKQAFFKQALDDTPSGSDLHTNIAVTCMSTVISLRFPIPDLRGLSEVAWWRRSLRDEILQIEITDGEFTCAIRDHKTQQKFLVKAREIKASVKLKPEEASIPFVKVSEGRPDNSCNSDRTFNWPRLLVVVSPVMQPSVLEEDQELSPAGPDLNMSWEKSYFHQPETEPSPFSSKKVMYESEQMVMPGDQDEMRDFMKKTITNSRLVLELNIPRINILLESKDFLEILYNRFANDMLLWQPTAPTPRDPLDNRYHVSGGLDLASQLAGSSVAERFGMCKSGLQFDSESDEDDEPDSLQFYSVYDHASSSMHSKQHRSRHGGQIEHKTGGQHYMSFTLNLSHGKLTMGMPIKNPDGSIKESEHGECLLEVEDGCLFTVTAYKGNDNESYLSLQANRVALYHDGCVVHPFRESLDSTRLSAPDHMKCCLYLSDDGVSSKTGGSVGKGGNSLHMVALAMKNSFDPIGNIKTSDCAIAVRGATLRHYMCQPEYHWCTQLGDFFDVIDEQIMGYDMPAVVTQLHAHFWGCGIDYRPLYLPLKSFVLLESLSISSNLVYEAKESLLRFLIDDAALYISEKCNETKVNLKRDYVSVIDLGMLELSLRLSNHEDKNPKTDLKVSNNVVHIRTCADSCSALARLLLYLSSDGDEGCHDHQVTKGGSNTTQPVEVIVEDEPSPKQSKGDSPVSHTHSDQMKQLMEEAMRELNGDSPSPNNSPKDREHIVHIPCTLKQDPGSEMFLFPDEDEGMVEEEKVEEDDDDVEVLIDITPPGTSPVSIGMSSGSGGSWAEPDGFYNDEEFCVLDDPGMGVLRHSGEPEVKVLDDGPINIKQDHFAPPMCRGDQLNAPLDFPTPTMRYTLQEMTIVWHIYGGQDLRSSGSNKNIYKPDLRGSSPAHSGEKRQPGGSGSSSPLRKPSDKPTHNVANMRWQERGGPERDHSVLMELQMNKVRFRHETYPSDAKQSSRQILLINDIEVRDRLAQSQINKFLYLYSSEARPKRTHANMVLVKALHIQPDPDVDTEECCLRISLQPLRFNIDQDALFFLRDFFTEVSTETSQALSPDHKPSRSPTDKKACTVRISKAPPQIIPNEAVQSDHPIHSADESSNGMKPSNDKTKAPAPPIFFKSFVFSPDVLIKLDYEGKRVDMDQGTFLGLLVGLGQLNHSELTLKRLHHRHGLLGIDRLILYALNEWSQDIKKSQLPRVLGGVGPMHSFVQLFQGMFDLVRLPVEQYKRDGRLVRGIQRGANSFGTSTAMAVVELTNRFVKLLQVAAETAYDVVSPGPSVSTRAITYGPFGQQRLARQPTDFREGMANAFNVVREGLGDTATAIMQTAMEEHEHKGVSGAVGGILRQIPPSVIRPLILATEATSSVLGGVRNQMLPDARKEDAEKWRSKAK